MVLLAPELIFDTSSIVILYQAVQPALDKPSERYPAQPVTLTPALAPTETSASSTVIPTPVGTRLTIDEHRTTVYGSGRSLMLRYQQLLP